MSGKHLKGEPEFYELDAGGRTMPYTLKGRSPEGLDVVLTIDETIQYLARKAIDKAIEDNKVLNGAVAKADPRMVIFSTCFKTDYDLNNPFAAPIGVEGGSENWKGYTSECHNTSEPYGEIRQWQIHTTWFNF